MCDSIARCDLSLSGLTVLTEAATGPYVVTPLLAAMASARKVYAAARDSQFGSADEAAKLTYGLARKLAVESRIEVVGNVTREMLAEADIVTNSGHLRPLTAAKISQMRPTTVVALMYENWEFRASDLDLEACRRRGIRIGGTNERHVAVGVFDFLGVMAVKLLLDAGVAVYGSRILLVCDNAFASYIEVALRRSGACVQVHPGVPDCAEDLDAVLVAATPRGEPVLTQEEMLRIARQCPGAVVAQFFGDLNRDALESLGIPICPQREPEKGHMGILLSDIGPEPVVRLQTGGLKAGEELYRCKVGTVSAADCFAQVL
jgi:hypothetical protein